MESLCSFPIEEFDFDFEDERDSIKQLQAKLERKNSAFLNLKHKIIATDSVLSNYKQCKLILEEREKQLESLKCCYENASKKYKNILECNYSLEAKCEKQKDELTKVKDSYTHCKDECQAIKSHSRQLEILIKDLESKLEGKEIELRMSTNREENSNLTKELNKLKQERLRNLNLLVTFGNIAYKDLNANQRKLFRKYRTKLQEISDCEDKFNDNSSSVDTGRGSSDEDLSPWMVTPTSPCLATPEANTVVNNKTYCDVALSPIRPPTRDIAINTENSDTTNNVSDSNSFIESIFKEMVVSYPMITPIPPEPTLNRRLKHHSGKILKRQKINYHHEIFKLKYKMAKICKMNKKLHSVIKKNIQLKEANLESKQEVINTDIITKIVENVFSEMNSQPVNVLPPVNATHKNEITNIKLDEYNDITSLAVEKHNSEQKGHQDIFNADENIPLMGLRTNDDMIKSKKRVPISKLQVLKRKYNTRNSKISEEIPYKKLKNSKSSTQTKNLELKTIKDMQSKENYEKAVKIMKELNMQKESINKVEPRKSTRSQCNTPEIAATAIDVNNKNSCDPKCGKSFNTIEINNLSVEKDRNNTEADKEERTKVPEIETILNTEHIKKRIVTYEDLTIFDNSCSKEIKPTTSTDLSDTIFINMLRKHGKIKIDPKTNNFSQLSIDAIYNELDSSVCQLKSCLPENYLNDFNLFIERISANNPKTFLRAVIKFLMHYNRTQDTICGKTPPSPPMTKCEEILLLVLNALESIWTGFELFPLLLSSIEYTLFRLNSTPEIQQLESLSHFYAIICRFKKYRSRLRVFILDAIYCLSFKAIPLSKQCLDAWPSLLPQSHHKQANDTLVFAIVFLLYFFKCSNNMYVPSHINHADVMRNLLKKKYGYKPGDWSENLLMEKIKSHISNIGIKSKREQKVIMLLVMSLAKRCGPSWTQTNLVEGFMLPVLSSNQSEGNKAFAAKCIGALLRPYPDTMKLHSVLTISKLIILLETSKEQPQLEDAIIGTLIMLKKFNRKEILDIITHWNPKRLIPHELERTFKGLIRERSIQGWSQIY